MPDLLVVGGGLFGSLAAAYARSRGIHAKVFDPGLDGGASAAAAGLFQESWAGCKFAEHFRQAVPLLDQLFVVRTVSLQHDDGRPEPFLFVPPTAILERDPIRERVTAVGDGWLEAAGRRHQGWVYIAAGIWCRDFAGDLDIVGKAGASFLFAGVRPGRIRVLGRSRQAVAFDRDPGLTYFGDGTAEPEYTEHHARQSLERAAALGLCEQPLRKLWGYRPYTPKGPVFRRLGQHTWLATGGRKLGTILGASYARRLVDEELTPG